MDHKKRLKLKDKIAIHIKKTKPLSFKICLILGVLLLAILIGLGVTYEPKQVMAPEELTEDTQFRITFTGDIQISDNIRELAHKVGYDGLFEGISKYWESSDYVVANVSGPILRYDVSHYTSTREKSEISNYLRPAALRGFMRAGINLPSFANEDAFNYGRTGIRSTISLLDEYEVDYLGIAKDVNDPICKILEYSFLNERGETEKRKIAILSVNDSIRKRSTVKEGKEGVVNSSLLNVYDEIYQASLECDYVISYVYFTDSEESSDSVKEKAQAMIDSGADVVIGNSRQLQGVETYGEGVIAYGLGNFVTDEPYSYSRDSSILDFVVKDSGEVFLNLTPIRIEEGEPEVTTKKLYLERIQTALTKNLSEDSYQISKDGVIQISLGHLPELKQTDSGEAILWRNEDQ